MERLCDPFVILHEFCHHLRTQGSKSWETLGTHAVTRYSLFARVFPALFMKKLKSTKLMMIE